jgi:hypothetical protein
MSGFLSFWATNARRMSVAVTGASGTWAAGPAPAGGAAMGAAAAAGAPPAASRCGLGLLFDGVDVVVDVFGVLVVAQNLPLHRQGGVVCFVLGGQRPLRHDAERVCGANLDDALRRLLAEHDILRLNPPHGRGKLVCKQLNEQRVRELLLDFGTHGGRCGSN